MKLPVKKKQAVLFLTGVIFFAIGLVIYPDESIRVGIDFNPFLALGLIFFGVGSVIPLMK